MTRQQYRALSYINDVITSTGITPSYDEIKDALGLRSKSYIHRIVRCLIEDGKLQGVSGAHRSVRLTRQGKEFLAGVEA